ncbi:MAG: dipeptidyl-peptidase 3 family protein [Prolixibacteraceae bacterium]
MNKVISVVLMTAFFYGCASSPNSKKDTETNNEMKDKVEEYAPFELKTDLSVLTENEKQMLPLLFEAADIMNEIFWVEAFGNVEELVDGSLDEYTRMFVKINYGPWDRLRNNEPFIKGYGEKPPGANFYPPDMTKAEFEAWDEPTKTSQYTLIRRGEDGKLKAIPYRVAFEEKVKEAADLLRQAAELAEGGLKIYLEKRAEALITDEYYESDVAWMEMKDNTVEYIVGPIENYEDQLFGYKTAHESFILIKDKEWSRRLDRFKELLPGLQKDLPTEQKYKDEMPGMDSDLGVYDAVYYTGDCNAGSKTIAINLPNDERVRNNVGSRKLQLKNSMQAKFDKILVPISELLIAEDQRKHVTFDAFFENTMFHEVAHGLGLGNTVDKNSTVREALKETYTSIEESKADILGLWSVYRLNEMGELGEKDIMDNFVTFMAGIFRSVRFGAASAHGKANMMRFYYFQETGAFERNEATGTYRVNFEKMKQAMLALSNEILVIQGEGDYDTATKMIEEKGFIREKLQKDLNRISETGIPRDIRFVQGPNELGME